MFGTVLIRARGSPMGAALVAPAKTTTLLASNADRARIRSEGDIIIPSRLGARIVPHRRYVFIGAVSFNRLRLRFDGLPSLLLSMYRFLVGLVIELPTQGQFQISMISTRDLGDISYRTHGLHFSLFCKREVWMPWKASSVMEERLRFVAR